jgi:hypothetical protein
MFGNRSTGSDCQYLRRVGGHHGTSVALERMLYVEAGTLLVAMGLVFLLPMRAREGDGH